MTIRYIRSGATGSNDGTSWANAFTDFQNTIFNVGSGGDTYYVAEDHLQSKTNGNFTRNVINTVSTPYKIICANHLGSTPPGTADLAVGAQFQTTLGNNISFGAGVFRYWYGIYWRLGDGNNNPLFQFGAGNNSGYDVFENCTFEIYATGSTAKFQASCAGGSGPGRVRFINCFFKFGATGQTFELDDYTSEFIGGGVLPGSIPTTLFTFGGSTCASLHRADGFDTSLVTGTVVGAIASGQTFNLQNCKLGSGVALGVPTDPYGAVILSGSDSGSKAYRNEISRQQGKLTTEETIVRTGGASDGSHNVSWKVVSTANVGYPQPFQTFDIMGFYTQPAASPAAAVTATIELVTDNVTLKDIDIWVELEYLGSPMSEMVTSRPNPISAGTNLTTSTATWTTTGLGTPVKQKLTVSFTPQQSGLYRARVYVAKASTTLYIDPYITIS